MSSRAASKAAGQQSDAAKYAADLQWEQFQKIQDNLRPYMEIGTGQIPNLLGILTGNGLNTQFDFRPTQEQLEQTPGYQFTLRQGLKGIDNTSSAKGWGMSGAQARAIADYTTGLADQTYQQQYQNALQNFTTNYGIVGDQYNRLANLLALGQNAAAGVGNAGLQTASNVGNLLTSGANAQAAGTIGSANAMNQGINSIAQGASLYALLNNNPGLGG